ncbi:MAG: antitoxin (DNA-binding transcriptional repressor) of toxin-antitoxin stability system [Paracoccaceae bacterium]
MGVKTISKGKLKPKMLEYFREVEATGESLIVTDHGREVLEIRPVRDDSNKKTNAEILAEYRASGPPPKGMSEEDLLAPAMPWQDWNVMKEVHGDDH